MTIEVKIMLLLVLAGFVIPIIGIATVDNDVLQKIVKAAMWLWVAIALLVMAEIL
jgi:hypothetical protein